MLDSKDCRFVETGVSTVYGDNGAPSMQKRIEGLAKKLIDPEAIVVERIDEQGVRHRFLVIAQASMVAGGNGYGKVQAFKEALQRFVTS